MKKIKLMKGLELTVKGDGTWLNFKSDGKQASLRLESIAEDKVGIVASAIGAWCQSTQNSEAPVISTKLKYEQKLSELSRLHTLKQYAVMEEYAFANSTVKIGDMFTDHLGTIKVEEIKICVQSGVTSCIYIGPIYTVKGKPAKNKMTREAYQCNEAQNFNDLDDEDQL